MLQFYYQKRIWSLSKVIGGRFENEYNLPNIPRIYDILKYIKEKEWVTSLEIAKLLGKDRATAMRYLKELNYSKILTDPVQRKIGVSKPTFTWSISNNFTAIPIYL